MVLAPEHPLVATLTAPDRRAEVDAYVAQAASRDRDRAAVDRPREDRRRDRRRRDQPDQRRADPDLDRRLRPGRLRHRRDHGRPGPRRARLRLRRRVRPADPAGRRATRRRRRRARSTDAYLAHAADEVLVNSGPYDGHAGRRGRPGDRREAGRARGKAKATVTYRLRDWLISRQRYWGTPIPVIYCERDGIVPVPEEELPVRLPDTVDYRGSGENPLARDEAFLNVTCPKCGGPARRETDTMDTFIDSSWYWFRYLSPEKSGGPIDRALVDAWTPVDAVHGRRRARRHAPAVRPRVHEDDARHRARRPGRAVHAAVQPGPDPRPRRRADVEVARQHRSTPTTSSPATEPTPSACS